MPCYTTVKVEVDFVIRDRAAFEKALTALNGSLVANDATRFTYAGHKFRLRDGVVSLEGEVAESRADAVTKSLDRLRAAYAKEAVVNWGRKNKMTITEKNGKIQMTRYIR